MFSPDEIIVFLGPTLSVSDAQKHLDARYLPPAKQGDILSLVAQFKPKVIALIDGYFMQNLSVWHKEILYALDKGVILLGASSMGALRAAETAEFGMIGVGKIYELYRGGTLNDDDEVALAHAPAEQGYLPLSLPLINIRFTLMRAENEGNLSKKISEEILACARALYYPDRTLEQIVRLAKERGLSETLVAQSLQKYAVDQKKEDALLLLKQIKTLSREMPARESFYPTSLFNVLYNYDRRSYFSSTSLAQRQLAQYVSLHHPDFSDLEFQALNQSLVNLLARVLRIEVSKEEIEEEKKRFSLRHGLLFLSEEEWDEWRARNHLPREDFHELMSSKAKARKLQRSLIMGITSWKQTRSLLDELKMRNIYEEWSKRAADQQELLEKISPYYSETSHEEELTEELIETHLKATGWRPDLAYPAWADEAGFQNASELKIEMHKAKLVRDAKGSCKE